MRIFRHLSTFLFSSALHLLVAAPFVVSFQDDAPPPVEISGDEGSADTPSGLGGVEPVATLAPVSVSIYVPPANAPAIAATAATSAPATAKGPGPTSASGSSGSRNTAGVTRVGGPRPVKDVEGDGKAVQRIKGRRNPCEQSDEIVKSGPQEWSLSREMVDYYASHLNEAGKHANVAVHKDASGKRDGATLYLSRCSLMKQGGMRNGDVVHTINGRKVQTVPQALSTYLAVRDESLVTITFSRQGEQRTHRYTLR